MKLFILKYDKDAGNFLCSKVGTKDVELVKVDPFVGCALHVPDGFDNWTEIYKGMIGSIVEIPDDCHLFNGVYLPNEGELS